MAAVPSQDGGGAGPGRGVTSSGWRRAPRPIPARHGAARPARGTPGAVRAEGAGPLRARRSERAVPCRSWPWTGWWCTRWCCSASWITSTGAGGRSGGAALSHDRAGARPGPQRGPEGARGREGPGPSGTPVIRVEFRSVPLCRAVLEPETKPRGGRARGGWHCGGVGRCPLVAAGVGVAAPVRDPGPSSGQAVVPRALLWL